MRIFVSYKSKSMLSKTCEYALRAMIYIAQQSKDGGVINIKEIAANVSSPELFIAKILQQLSRQNFLHSVKGRNGGFYISDQQAAHSLADIITAIDGEKMFKGCGLGLPTCSDANPCPIHDSYKEVRKLFNEIYGNTALSKFRTEKNFQHLKLSCDKT